MDSGGTTSAGCNLEYSSSGAAHETFPMAGEVADAKKARRRYTNRESARRVRARRNAEWHALQQQLSTLTRQNAELSSRVDMLHGQKQNLLTHLVEVIARHRVLTLENAALQQELVDCQGGVDPYGLPASTSSSMLQHPGPKLAALSGSELAPKLPAPSDIPNFDDLTWVDVVNAAESCRLGLPTPFSSSLSEQQQHQHGPKQQQQQHALLSSSMQQQYNALLPSSGFEGQSLAAELQSSRFDSSRLYNMHRPSLKHDSIIGNF